MSDTLTTLPAVGQRAPAFSLPAHPGGKQVGLSQFKGRNVVLYFYPRDNTPGCTQEACDFRDLGATFDAADAVVLGVSTDDLASHERFAHKFELPFTLLADVDHAVAEKYGVWVEKQQYGRKFMGVQRATFVINRQGKLAAVWPKVSVKGHAEDVAEVLKALG